MGGGSVLWSGRGIAAQGRSPRGRGKRGGRVQGGRRDGSIPAWAGEAQQHPSPPRVPWVDPRVGGGSEKLRLNKLAQQGRSPRGRGKPDEGVDDAGLVGSIPAWAGEARGFQRHPAPPGVDPRVGGGSPATPAQVAAGVGRSPRGRGKPVPCQPPWPSWRSIPAWAGEALGRSFRPQSEKVDPRVGGGSAHDTGGR